MKFGGSRWFYIGVAVTLIGIVLMSLPEAKCEDCDDEVSDSPIYKVTEFDAENLESPLND